MRWHLKGRPLLVQVEAMRREEGQDRFGYWLDTGLGKTPLDLNRFVEDFGSEKVSGHLIICPNHLKLNWVDQMRTWMPEVPPVCVWPDEPTKDTVQFIVNYQAIWQSGGQVIREFIKRHGGRVQATTDESHNFKTHSSNTTKAMLGFISPEVTTFRELTGSPVTLNVMDYWPQLRALGLFEGSNPYAFRNRYAVMGGYMGKKVKGTKNEEELMEKIGSRVFRALFRDWNQDVPEATHGVLGFEMTSKQTRIYREMAEDFMTMIGDENIEAEMVVTQALKLQQIGRGFALKDGKAVPMFASHKENPSFVSLLGGLEDAPGKTIIFTVHKHTTEEVFTTLNQLGIGAARLRGGMKAEEVEREKSDFNNIAKCRVLVAQISVAKEGHTLLGDQNADENACATSIFYESNYNWGDRKQAKGRNVRVGQRRSVRWLDMVGSPIDKRIVAVMQERTDFIGTLVDALRSTPR